MTKLRARSRRTPSLYLPNLVTQCNTDQRWILELCRKCWNCTGRAQCLLALKQSCHWFSEPYVSPSSLVSDRGAPSMCIYKVSKHFALVGVSALKLCTCGGDFDSLRLCLCPPVSRYYRNITFSLKVKATFLTKLAICHSRDVGFGATTWRIGICNFFI